MYITMSTDKIAFKSISLNVCYGVVLFERI